MGAHEEDLVAEIEALRKENGGLRQRVETLTAKIAELEALLVQDSKNSSLPPSSDSPKSRAERRAEARQQQKDAARRCGKQPGAPGANLAMRERPDEVVLHEPECCGSCGEDLSNAPVEGCSARQVFDTPDPVLVCVEHRSVAKRCRCGTLNHGAFPREATAPTCYGPNVRAIALYLLHAQHCSVERTAEALSEMFGASVSSGAPRLG